MAVLQDSKVDEFQHDGVVLLKGVFDGWIDLLREGVEVNMNAPGPWGCETSPPFLGLEQRLNPGDALIAEEFPLVFAQATAD
jgi:hypothetical protein